MQALQSQCFELLPQYPTARDNRADDRKDWAAETIYNQLKTKLQVSFANTIGRK
jgi:hypothetical protein